MERCEVAMFRHLQAHTHLAGTPGPRLFVLKRCIFGIKNLYKWRFSFILPPFATNVQSRDLLFLTQGDRVCQAC